MQLPAELVQRARRIKLALFDVDGVLTGGQVIYTDNGSEAKAFDIQDGHGLKLLTDMEIRTGIISGRNSSVVTRRAQELGVSFVHQGVKDKRACVDALCGETGVGLAECSFMGDDWPDLPVMTRVGLAAAPAQAAAEVRERAHWIATRRGGEGAVREFCDMLLAARGATLRALAPYLS